MGEDKDNVVAAFSTGAKRAPPSNTPAVKVPDDEAGVFDRDAGCRTMHPDFEDDDLYQGAEVLRVWQRNGNGDAVTTEYQYVHRLVQDGDNTLHFWHIVPPEKTFPLRRLPGERGVDFCERVRTHPSRPKYLKRVIASGEWCDIEFGGFFCYVKEAPHFHVEDVNYFES